jgi:hypothetical protein
MRQGIEQVAPIRDAVIGSGPPAAVASRPRSSSLRPAASRCRRLQQLQLRMVMGRADVLDIP